ILSGDYSPSLKERTLSIIRASEEFDKCSFPLMPYIAAWNEEDRIIWYEFVGHQFVELLDTNVSGISRVFRESILDQRLYRYSDLARSHVEEEVITRHQLFGERINLRESVQQKRQVEAIYQVALPSGKVIWLKDQGRVEVHPRDNISLSLGCLTDVTKEMEQKEVLERIGYFDDLTGLPQKKIMERLLEVKVGERQRGHIDDFSVFMMDVDHFKSVNDTHGHQAGDEILREIASIMIATKRKEEDVGRFGGEEFYGICRGNLQNGIEFADRIRRRVKGHVFSHNGTDIHITISAGVASAQEIDLVSMEDLIELADKRLYQAKHEGRDRVIGGKS
ncbi:MAG: GGDEF domain-containing protein, partial [Thermodesulfobacteriota bacterium]